MLTISSSSVFGNIQISLHLTPKNHFVFKEKEMVPVIYIEWLAHHRCSVNVWWMNKWGGGELTCEINTTIPISENLRNLLKFTQIVNGGPRVQTQAS